MNQDANRRGELADYLELLRVPNLPTSMADVTMGYLFVQAGGQQWEMDADHFWPLLVLAVASALLYAAGVVLNDVFDLDIDREERPERPIPSGRVPLGAARLLGWSLLVLGAALPWGVTALGGTIRPGLFALGLALAIVFYDRLLKRTPLGPLAMGGCRMLNVLLGMSVLAGRLGPEHFAVAGGIGVYIAGVTWLARSEARESGRWQLAAATVVMLVGIGLLGTLPHWTENVVALLREEPGRWFLLMGVLAAMICWRCLAAVVSPSRERVQTAVTNSIMSLVILDAIACFAVRGTSWAIVVLLFLVPAMVLSRRFRST